MGKSKIENEKKINPKIIFLAVLVVALLLALGWTHFLFIPQKMKNSSANNDLKYQLLNPARKFVSQEDLIVNIQSLRDELNGYEGRDDISVYFEFLNTGANISVNKDAEFWPASTLKVPVAMAVTKKVEEGKWKWDNRLVLMASDKDEKFGTLYREPTGSTFTIEELVRRTLVESDNTASFILVRNLEASEMDNAYEHLGLANFFSSNGEIGAKKYSVFFRALYNSSYLSEDNSEKLLNYLSQSKFNEYLGSGLPSELKFSHKIGTGSDKNVYLDSGIVYAKNRPYILTVMIKSEKEESAMEMMKKISGDVYEYISKYNEGE